MLSELELVLDELRLEELELVLEELELILDELVELDEHELDPNSIPSTKKLL